MEWGQLEMTSSLDPWGSGTKTCFQFLQHPIRGVHKEKYYQGYLTMHPESHNFVKPVIKHRNRQPPIVYIATYNLVGLTMYEHKAYQQ